MEDNYLQVEICADNNFRALDFFTVGIEGCRQQLFQPGSNIFISHLKYKCIQIYPKVSFTVNVYI